MIFIIPGTASLRVQNDSDEEKLDEGFGLGSKVGKAQILSNYFSLDIKRIDLKVDYF